MPKFTHAQQLFGSTGLTALDAYQGGAVKDELVLVHHGSIMHMAKSDHPSQLADAFDLVLMAAENLAKWSAALMEAAYRIQNIDAFEWSAAENTNDGIHRRYQHMRQIADLISNTVG